MKRRLFNLAAWVSAVLCAALVGLCVRSKFASDSLTLANKSFNINFSTPRGSFAIYIGDGPSPSPGAIRYSTGGPFDLLDFARSNWNLVEVSGFAYGWYGDEGHRLIHVPLWFLVLAAAIYPAIRFRALPRERRIERLGLCSNCGYDLCATPERCPECGAIPAPEVTQDRVGGG